MMYENITRYSEVINHAFAFYFEIWCFWWCLFVISPIQQANLGFVFIRADLKGTLEAKVHKEETIKKMWQCVFLNAQYVSLVSSFEEIIEDIKWIHYFIKMIPSKTLFFKEYIWCVLIYTLKNTFDFTQSSTCISTQYLNIIAILFSVEEWWHAVVFSDFSWLCAQR